MNHVKRMIAVLGLYLLWTDALRMGYSRLTPRTNHSPKATESNESEVLQEHERVKFSIYRCDQFKECREVVDEDSNEITFRAAAADQMLLTWVQPPRRVLFLTKPLDMAPDLSPYVVRCAKIMALDMGMTVVVERSVYERCSHKSGLLASKLLALEESANMNRNSTLSQVDAVVTIGGDGVLMHVNRMFPTAAPPVIALAGGSLGFLAPFEVSDASLVLSTLTKYALRVTCRMRLKCVFDDDDNDIGAVLNEVVVERGPSPYLAQLEVWVNDVFLTTMQADGVIIATPTGSTAYSMAAGGSMVHPAVPAIMVTPICPHSLSCRPIILPDSAQLRCFIPLEARADAMVSLDGNRKKRLKRGQSMRISMSPHPLPTINCEDETADWFKAIATAFQYNERTLQRPLQGLQDDGNTSE